MHIAVIGCCNSISNEFFLNQQNILKSVAVFRLFPEPRKESWFLHFPNCFPDKQGGHAFWTGEEKEKKKYWSVWV